MTKVFFERKNFFQAVRGKRAHCFFCFCKLIQRWFKKIITFWIKIQTIEGGEVLKKKVKSKVTWTSKVCMLKNTLEKIRIGIIHNTLLKTTLHQGITNFLRHTFCKNMTAWGVIKYERAWNPVKSRISSAFEDDFQSSKKLDLIDDIAFLESENDFEAVR